MVNVRQREQQSPTGGKSRTRRSKRKLLAEGSVFGFLRDQAKRQATLNRTRRCEILHSALNRLMAFRRGRDFAFSQFDGRLLERFEAYLINEGLKRNTIGFYMRTLRTYYNIAVEEGITEDRMPFRKVYKSKDKTVKRALTLVEIRRIKELDLSARPALDFARDMLLFSFYARGMAFVDMSYLRKADLQGNHFVYQRRKTGQTLTVEWVEQMQQIVDKHPHNDTDFLLPIITLSGKDERRQYLSKTTCIYRNLKKVGILAQVSGICTLYRARHTWATLARSNNVPIAVISEALGHDSERTTEIYIDSIQTEVVDNVNRQLLEALA